MECPVCRQGEVEEISQSCPQCHSNVQAFQVLESIEKKLKSRKYFIYFLSAFVLILIAAWSFTNSTSGDKLLLDQTRQLYKDSLTEQQSRFDELTVEFEEMELSNVILGEKLKTFEFIQSSADGESPEEDYHVHVVKKGESLWSIAEEYHSDGNRQRNCRS